jgi:hypothetical protein
MKTKKNVEAIERLAMKKDKEISDKLIQKMTQEFDADGDIIVGDEDELIMLRSGSPSDKEYNITVEKVSPDEDDEDNKNYDILDQFSMKNKDKKTMKKAIESYLKNGGSFEYLKHFSE